MKNFPKQANALNMVRCIAICLSLLFASEKSQAQFATIPDANFVAYLQTNFPAAMAGNQMDTTHAVIVSTTLVDINNLGIQNLSGIEYFTGLDRLEIREPSLATLPALPAGLDTLLVESSTLLTTLPALPSGLVWLGCAFMPQLSTLPPLPNSLLHLGFSYTGVWSLPPLPPALQSLECVGSPLTSMAGMWPTSLEYITCSHINSFMTGSPFISLPVNLIQLEMQNCNITDLPALPSSLTYLDCSQSLMQCLPQLPAGLVWLNTSFTGITCLPNRPSAVFNSYNLCNEPDSANISNVSVFGGNNGSINLIMSSCSAPYNFQWNTGATTSSVSNLTAGTYTCTITDVYNGVDSFIYNVTQPTPVGWATIPDANFVAYLQTNFPAAMSGNQMDTLHPSIVNATEVYCSNLSISSLDGIQYFDNLDTLVCYGNNLVALPSLPQKITFLDCSYNPFLSSLPTLPQNLIILVSVGNSNLFSLPASIPPTLKLLSMANCSTLNSLPALPAGLDLLDLLGCSNLFSLPSLPDSLHVLHVDGCPAATSISNLPALLERFSCNGSGVSFLPPLPETLTELYCQNNSISCLPKLPPYLSTLFASGNPVSCIPNLPNVSLTSDIGFNYCVPHVFSVTNNATCSGICNGQAEVQTSAGTTYNYSWSNGHFDQTSSGISTATNLCSGTEYEVEVSPALGGCSSYETFTVNSTISFSVFAAATTNVSCNGGSDGQLTAFTNGGTPPYQYSIDGGITFQVSNVFTNLLAGFYNITVMDSLGCSASDFVTITEPPVLSFPLITNVITCNANPILLCPSVTGGTPPYNYSWSNGGFTSCITVTSSGTYSIIVTDQNGCTASTSINVSYSPGWVSFNLDNITLPSCGLCDGIGTVSAVGGSFPFTYLWSNGNTTATSNTLCENTDYYVVAIDSFGCVDTLNFNLSCYEVWPGDANNDGVADNVDVLALGIGYGTYDELRPNATINWQPEVGVSWDSTFANGMNYKHADCNGDGVIADDDTIAIIQNFSLTHPLRPAVIPPSLTDPPLYFNIQIDSTNSDTIIYIPIMLGNSSIPANDIYGIAFTVNYDTALVKADSLTIDFMNSWMGVSGSSLIGVGINDATNGKLYVGITRTNHADTSGFGEISRLGIVTVDNISARLTSSFADTLLLSFSDVVMIAHDEQNKPVNPISDSLIMSNATAIGENDWLSQAVSIYPNPANNFALVEFPEDFRMANFRLTTLSGSELELISSIKNNKMILNLSDVPNGIYILTMESAYGMVVKKLSVLKN